MSNYRLLNNALRTGLFRAKRGSRFAVDCDLLEVDREKSRPDKIIVKGHSDAVDSALYAFKFSPAYIFEAPATAPVPGSAEHAKAFEQLDHHPGQCKRLWWPIWPRLEFATRLKGFGALNEFARELHKYLARFKHARPGKLASTTHLPKGLH